MSTISSLLRRSCCAAGPAAPLSISSPSQVLPELALEQSDAQSGAEDEVEAAAPCAAELVRPLTAEARDCSALVAYQPALQGMSFAKAASAGEDMLHPLPTTQCHCCQPRHHTPLHHSFVHRRRDGARCMV